MRGRTRGFVPLPAPAPDLPGDGLRVNSRQGPLAPDPQFRSGPLQRGQFRRLPLQAHPARHPHSPTQHAPTRPLALSPPTTARAARRYLASKAEALGADLLPGFAAASFLPHASKATTAAAAAPPSGAPLLSRDVPAAVGGVLTGAFGLSRDGARPRPGAAPAPGTPVRARCTLLAEGCRGYLAERAAERFGLREAAGAEAQSYGLGVKEVWQARLGPGGVVPSA